MEQLFEYETLSKKPLEIRILQLLRSEAWDSPVACTLKAHELLPEPEEYFKRPLEALSYTWGASPKYIRRIKVNKKSFFVTENLESFLLHRRRHDHDVALWIDAICINQQDMSEKNEQIPLMGFIYGSAARMTVWLGEASTDSEHAMKWLHDLGAGSPYQKMPLLSRESLTALQSLLDRPWWSRVWIIQEIVRGGCHCKLHDVRVMCGKQTISWMNVVLAAVRMKSYEDDQRQYFPNIDKILELEALRDSPLGLTFTGLETIQRPQLHLADMLSRCRRFDASNPSDKVFALHSLIEACLPRSFKPQYEIPVAETFTRLALNEYANGDLELLRHCGTSTCDVPSWVPDWSVKTEPIPLAVRKFHKYFDVPWWSEPPDNDAPQAEEYGSWRDIDSTASYLVPGYSFRGYQFRGYPVDHDQASGERQQRFLRLKLATEGREVVGGLKIVSEDSEEVINAMKHGLPAGGKKVKLEVRQKYNFLPEPSRTVLCADSGRCIGPVEQGEIITEQRQKTHIIINSQDFGTPYSTGTGRESSICMDREHNTIAPQGILWDSIDTTHTEPFTLDVDACWQNATRFMVAVGCCKKLAMSHPAAIQRYPQLEDRAKAFWTTLTAGQIGMCDKFHWSDADDQKMAFMDWMPELDSSWKRSAPVLTPITSGLLHLVDTMQNLGLSSSSSILALKSPRTWSEHFDSTVSRQQTCEGRHETTTLIPKEWTSDDIVYYQEQFDSLASSWQEQPFDLYHRPFQLLNVVPDPYWHYRKQHDKLALLKTQKHRAMPTFSRLEDPGVTSSDSSYDLWTDRTLHNLRDEVSMDPTGTLDIGMEKYALGRRFFVTKKGYFGLGPKDICPGDQIAVFFGLAVPIVLRKHRQDTSLPGRRVLGEAYIHDIMKGEVLEQWKAGYIEAGNIVLR